jgi:hypothetical protein
MNSTIACQTAGSSPAASPARDDASTINDAAAHASKVAFREILLTIAIFMWLQNTQADRAMPLATQHFANCVGHEVFP